uniref:Uncharacterized protein n=1 Tax=Setaria viridis TaxID=4556 RepID=A0A4U6WJM1_SETVI|nr:hypothetical protein SEVIR_1G364750v2 [Setaria viridis]
MLTRGCRCSQLATSQDCACGLGCWLTPTW